MIDLKEKHCLPCKEGSKPFDKEQILRYIKKIAPNWQVIADKKLQKEFRFKNFRSGMAFAQKIAEIAENENHHPDICIRYKEVIVELSTHNIVGLSENDFILAAKIDEI
ncbi:MULTISPECIES: 4a-hydroxytetrahydrobiopterin dehydratase [unclassified Saccharicrinis]|uniref:4a-hydroxytetrahydrobiopterin dehydratase n=1 Tax=unclassified Saccharicrinis TaxID=2646859 RepID=UPI003D34FD48